MACIRKPGVVGWVFPPSWRCCPPQACVPWIVNVNFFSRLAVVDPQHLDAFLHRMPCIRKPEVVGCVFPPSSRCCPPRACFPSIVSVNFFPRFAVVEPRHLRAFLHHMPCIRKPWPSNSSTCMPPASLIWSAPLVRIPSCLL